MQNLVLHTLCILGVLLYSEIIDKATAQTVESQERYPFNARSSGSGTSWTSPTNIQVSDNAYATASVNNGGNTQRLEGLQFTFNIPQFATIRGIEVYWEGNGQDSTFVTTEVNLFWNGGETSSKCANNACTSDTWTNTEITRKYGSPTDLWGSSGWNAARINSDAFGARIKVQRTGSGQGSRTVQMDSAKVVVYYIECGNIDCVRGTCTGPNACSCDAGWNGTTCNTPICTQGCVHGVCESPQVCKCDNLWNGTSCDNAICDSGCVHGTCTAPRTCTCDFGWTGATCNSPRCYESCNHGTCIGGDICECEPGWEGQRCNQATCDPPCGAGGTCNAEFTCDCAPGWSGPLCNIPQCSFDCGNGRCTAPDNCTCDFGWTGERCDIPICDPQCAHNGTCIAPNQCECDPASTYEGRFCLDPICTPRCENNGRCLEDGKGERTCECANGWNGTTCTIPLCRKFACNQGRCVAPDQCECNPGWTGRACDQVINPTTGGEFIITTGAPPVTTGDPNPVGVVEESSSPEFYDPLSLGAFIGIIVGGCVFCVLLCVGIGFLIWFKKSRYSFAPKVTETDDIPLESS